MLENVPLVNLKSPMTQDKIIVPLDVNNEIEALAWVEALPEVTWWKVGLELFVSSGPKILEMLKQRQKKIFLDLKLHDIPNTMAGATRAAAGFGVELLTVHATAGRSALQRTLEAAQEGAKTAGVKPPKILGITVLTSLTAQDLALDLKIPLELPEYALQMAMLCQEVGLAGAVCSPQEAQQLRCVCGDEFLLVCPGVRPHGSQTADQKRFMTPSQAVQAGASYLVIGRPITAAENPRQAWLNINQELAGVA